MTKLQVELAKANKRITKALEAHVVLDRVTIDYGYWNINVFVWLEDDIVASVYTPTNATTKQIVQAVHTKLRQES